MQITWKYGRSRVDSWQRATSVGVSLLTSALLVVGCKKPSESSAGTGAPSAAASVPVAETPVASGSPIPRELVVEAVNRAHLPVYSGPSGTLRGVIHVTGDPAPELPEVVRQIHGDCEPAREVYGHLFREGPGRTAADVLVTVTGYSGYVPEQYSKQEAPASNCSFSARTYALTFGQSLEVISKDHKPYVPDLIGAQMPAQLLAMPGGAGSALYPQAPGRYVLVDSMRIFARAEVLVLKYATHAVTGLDGRYQIERIPAGKVTVGVVWPQTGQALQREVEIKASQSTELNLDFNFNQASWRAASSAAPSASAASSAPPAASASAR